MKKPFYRYEDVPIFLAEEGKEPVMVFAASASISASQSIKAKKFIEDYNISLAGQSEDLHLESGSLYQFMLGSEENLPRKIPSSVEIIKSGQKISYPGGSSLFLEKDLYPGDYYITVRAREDVTLDYEKDIPYGEVDVIRNYAADDVVKGSLNIDYYMNTGNLYFFENLTGVMAANSYPQINEAKISGSFGDYRFYDGYLTSVSFSAEPFKAIESSVNIDLYGKMEYEEGYGLKMIESLSENKNPQFSVPHAINSKIIGSSGIGMEYPISFSYEISSNRTPETTIPLNGYLDLEGEIPYRVSKNEIDITVEIEGEKLDPFLKITGQRADVVIKLEDLGFDKDFTNNNNNSMKEFKMAGSLVLPDQQQMEASAQHGVIDQDTLSISDGGILKGKAKIKQSFR